MILIKSLIFLIFHGKVNTFMTFLFKVGSRSPTIHANLQELVTLLVPSVNSQSAEERQQPFMALLHRATNAVERQADTDYGR